MFTLKSVFVGLSAVPALFVAVMVYKLGASISPTKATGRGALAGYLSQIITSPVFWLFAVLIFFAAVFLSGKYYGWGHS